jgi:hypothetical protein
MGMEGRSGEQGKVGLKPGNNCGNELLFGHSQCVSRKRSPVRRAGVAL